MLFVDFAEHHFAEQQHLYWLILPKLDFMLRQLQEVFVKNWSVCFFYFHIKPSIPPQIMLHGYIVAL